MPPPSWMGMLDLGQDRVNRRIVDRLAGEGAVQIDDVQPRPPAAAKIRAWLAG